MTTLTSNDALSGVERVSFSVDGENVEKTKSSPFTVVVVNRHFSKAICEDCL